MVWKNSDFKEILIFVIIYEKNSLRERERERERKRERKRVLVYLLAASTP